MIEQAQIAGTLFLAAALIACGIFDVWVLIEGRGNLTVSALVRAFAKEYPVLPFAGGMLMGHLFW